MTIMRFLTKLLAQVSEIIGSIQFGDGTIVNGISCVAKI